MNGSYAVNNETLTKVIIEIVFKEIDWIEFNWIWLRGRNCVSNNVTYCVNVSYEGVFLRRVFGITTPNPQPGGQRHVDDPQLLIQYIGI